jgi:hypothetical protein
VIGKPALDTQMLQVGFDHHRRAMLTSAVS